MSKKLLTYALEMNGLRRIVAAPSLSHAATLLRVSRFVLKNNGEVSKSCSESEIANRDPGAVFACSEDSDGWQLVASSKRSRMLPTSGGYREGGGKPLEGESVAVQRVVRLSEERWAAFQALGGVAWLRHQLRAEPLPITSMVSLGWGKGTNGPCSIRLCAEDNRRYKAAGGAKWLRAAIEHSTALAEAESSGQTAFLQGKSNTAHAYPANGPQADFFRSGWANARALSDGVELMLGAA